MASEAPNMAVRGIMYMDTKVMEIPDVSSEVKFAIWSQ